MTAFQAATSLCTLTFIIASNSVKVF